MSSSCEIKLNEIIMSFEIVLKKLNKNKLFNNDMAKLQEIKLIESI